MIPPPNRGRFLALALLFLGMIASDLRAQAPVMPPGDWDPNLLDRKARALSVPRPGERPGAMARRLIDRLLTRDSEEFYVVSNALNLWVQTQPRVACAAIIPRMDDRRKLHFDHVTLIAPPDNWEGLVHYGVGDVSDVLDHIIPTPLEPGETTIPWDRNVRIARARRWLAAGMPGLVASGKRLPVPSKSIPAPRR